MKIIIESVGNGYTVTVWRNESDISPEVFVYQRLRDFAESLRFIHEPPELTIDDYIKEIIDPPVAKIDLIIPD